MARIRTVKPELFSHEELYEAEKETGLPIRLAFIGLFTCADREGRFKWRPRTLKLSTLPHDELDFSRVLDALVTRGFVVKYASETGEEFGYLPTFCKHQVINNRESASDLPDPALCLEFTGVATREPRVSDACSDACPTPAQGKGKEGKGREEEGKGKEGGAGGEDQIEQIFSYWQKRMDSAKSNLDDKRRKAIKAALAMGYTPADLCKAIRGCSLTPHNMGKNDQGQKYNGLALIFRSADQIDRFILNDTTPPRANGHSGASGIAAHNEAIVAAYLAGDVPLSDDHMTIDMEH